MVSFHSTTMFLPKTNTRGSGGRSLPRSHIHRWYSSFSQSKCDVIWGGLLSTSGDLFPAVVRPRTCLGMRYDLAVHGLVVTFGSSLLTLFRTGGSLHHLNNLGILILVKILF